MSPQSLYVITFSLIVFEKIVCFILGYLTIYLGYKLITSGAKGEFSFSADLHGVKAGLSSISPGLLFVLLGTLIIGYAIYVEKGAEYKEKINTATHSEDKNNEDKKRIVEEMKSQLPNENEFRDTSHVLQEQHNDNKPNENDKKRRKKC